MGREHDEQDSLTGFLVNPFGYTPPRPDAVFSLNHATPNQLWEALANSFIWSRVRGNRLPIISPDSARSQIVKYFNQMDESGHMSIGHGFGNEQMAPDPHSVLHASSHAAILYESLVQRVDAITTRAIDYHATHLNLCQSFMTKQGVRIPCARAKAPGVKLSPFWTMDQYTYALISRTRPIGQLVTGGQTALSYLNMAASLYAKRGLGDLFDVIVQRSKSVEVKLLLPIKKWDTIDGGFIAAFDHDEPLNDPLAWIVVNADGSIVSAHRSLEDFQAPDREPDLIIGGIATDTGSGSIQPTPAPLPQPVPAPTVDLSIIMTTIRNLQLARTDRPIQARILDELASDHPDYSRIADEVAGLHINPDQEQGPRWLDATAQLRAMK
jgi:hypothetical protein